MAAYCIPDHLMESYDQGTYDDGSNDSLPKVPRHCRLPATKVM
jgi:hypothetical protein